MTLNHTIAKRFPAADLAGLAAELGLPLAGDPAHDDRPAPTAAEAPSAAGALLVAAAGRGRAAELLAALAARAPDVPWASLPWPPAALAALHEALDRRLSREGLRDLCLRLGVDYDSLPGEGKRARARELVLAMSRAGRLADLLDESRTAAGDRPPRTPARPGPWSVARRPLLAAVLALSLLAGLAAARGRGWAAGPPLPEGVIGVAVAEFAETAECRRGPQGREASALVYETLGRELDVAGLARRVALTRVGRVCDAAAAVAAGRAVGAELVVWGWLPASTDGLLATFTPVGPAAPASGDLARAFEALFSGPEASLSPRLSGRIIVLSRFLLGLLHAAQGDYAAAEALYSAAVDSVGAERAAAGANSAELGRTLAVLLTERGKARAALGRAAAARADYDAAEQLNPDYLRLLVTRAAAAYSARDWATARRYLDRAALQDEPLPTIAYGYGLLEYYGGDYAAAVAHFDRAIALSAADGSDAALYHLARGYGYVELGDCAAATADFRAAAAAGAPEAVRQAAQAAGCAPAALAGGVGGAPACTPAPARLSPLQMAAAAPTRAEPTASVAATPSVVATPTPSVVATPTPGPLLLEVGPRGANVRRGPGAEYPVMATRRAGEQLEVLAASPSGEWLQVRVPGQGRGWVSAAYAAALGDLSALAIGPYQPGATLGGASPTPATGQPPATAAPRWPGAPGAPTPPPSAPGGPTPPRPTATVIPPPAYETATPPRPPTPTLLPPPTARAGGVSP